MFFLTSNIFIFITLQKYFHQNQNRIEHHALMCRMISTEKDLFIECFIKKKNRDL